MIMIFVKHLKDLIKYNSDILLLVLLLLLL